jgi:hypothetical protein
VGLGSGHDCFAPPMGPGFYLAASRGGLMT